MKILLTGATSFLGGYLLRELLSEGNEVFAPVRPGSMRKLSVFPQPGFRCFPGDMGRLPELSSELEKLGGDGLDVCVHLAWAGVGAGGRMNAELQRANVRAALELMRRCADFSCGRFLFAGSQAEYGVTLERVERGEQSGLPVTEEAPCEPLSEYGKGKLRVLREASALAEELRMDYRHLRIFSLYGAGDHESTLVSSCVRAALRGERAELGPCAQQWNFLHVRDCARAIAALCGGGSGDVPGRGYHRIYNIGSADTRPLRDFVREIFELAGERGQAEGLCRFVERPPGPEGTPFLSPDISRICAETGWRPEISFRDGVKALLEQKERE